MQFGEYVNKAGQVVHGDQLIFFAQLKDQVPITAGTFMAGLTPIKMFCIPAIALAIYRCASPENRARVKGIMLSGAITSIVCGITEPIEFSFLFVAPVLYGIHAVLAVQFYHGMACYIVEENGQLCVRKNHYYPHIPRIKFATVKENPHLGITFDTPLYQRYRAAPERFHFLGHVDNYVREIMGMLEYQDDLFPLCQEDA